MRRFFQPVIIAVLLTLSFACATSTTPPPEEGPPGPDRSAPRLLATVPASDSTEVSVLTTISAQFDEALFSGSITPTSFRVLRGGWVIPGTVQLSGDRLEYLPSEMLEYDSDYEVVVDGGIADLFGNLLGTEQRWNFRSETFAGDLPVVKVDPLGAPILDDPKIPARMAIEEAGGAVAYDAWIGIEVRGTSSQFAPKKQYGLETWDDAFEELETALLGMPEEADWILQGNYFDATLLRNYLALVMSRATGRYAPRMRFTEMFLAPTEGDYRYWGVYALMEKIKRDANRVNIKKLGDTDNSEPNISGGYLLQMDRVKDGDLYFDTARGTRLLYEYPKGEDITPDQAAWIQDYLNDFEAALYGPDFQDAVIGYRAFLEMESMVDFFLLNELVKNVDAFEFSTFMYKDRGGKLQMGPVWDFDLAMGNISMATPGGWLLCEARWIDRLREDPAFIAAAIARYRGLRLGLWSDAALEEWIEDALGELEGAAQRNVQKWYRDLGFAYEDRVAVLREWLEARLAWMDSNIDTLCD